MSQKLKPLKDMSFEDMFELEKSMTEELSEKMIDFYTAEGLKEYANNGYREWKKKANEEQKLKDKENGLYIPKYKIGDTLTDKGTFTIKNIEEFHYIVTVNIDDKTKKDGRICIKFGNKLPLKT